MPGLSPISQTWIPRLLSQVTVLGSNPWVSASKARVVSKSQGWNPKAAAPSDCPRFKPMGDAANVRGHPKDHLQTARIACRLVDCVDCHFIVGDYNLRNVFMVDSSVQFLKEVLLVELNLKKVSTNLIDVLWRLWTFCGSSVEHNLWCLWRLWTSVELLWNTIFDLSEKVSLLLTTIFDWCGLSLLVTIMTASTVTLVTAPSILSVFSVSRALTTSFNLSMTSRTLTSFLTALSSLSSMSTMAVYLLEFLTRTFSVEPLFTLQNWNILFIVNFCGSKK